MTTAPMTPMIAQNAVGLSSFFMANYSVGLQYEPQKRRRSSL